MILTRDWLGLSEPNFNPTIVSGRAIAAKVEYPGCPPFLAISAYLHTGKGIEEANLQLLQAIGEA
eukprot:2794034-Heterocapsa_arctica.AAC.1